MKRALFLIVLIATSLQAQVSNDRLLKSNQEPQNWLTYSGHYNAQRYSALSQITPENVKNLEQQWIFQARSLEKFEATPLEAKPFLKERAVAPVAIACSAMALALDRISARSAERGGPSSYSGRSLIRMPRSCRQTAC